MTMPLPRPTIRQHGTRPVTGSADWLRLARIARLLSWLTLAWMGIEGGVAIAAAVVAGSVALLAFGLDSGIEAMASVIVIWRFTGTRLASPTSERRAQRLVAISFFLLAPYIAFEAIHALVTADRAKTSIVGLVLTAGTAIFEPALGVTKRRIGVRLGSSATAGEGTQNLLCAYLAMAVSAGLAANTLFSAWWLDGVIALAIAGWAVVEGRRAWAGDRAAAPAGQQPPAVIVAAAEPGHHAGGCRRGAVCHASAAAMAATIKAAARSAHHHPRMWYSARAVSASRLVAAPIPLRVPSPCRARLAIRAPRRRLA
jgi:hypothetical protein